MVWEYLPVVLPLLVGLSLGAISVFVFRAGASRAHNTCFSALYLLSGVKSLSEGLRLVADILRADGGNFPAPATWATVAFLCATLMLPLLVLFVLLFPRPARRLEARPLYGILLFLPSPVFAYLMLAHPWGIRAEAVGFAFDLLAIAATLLAVLLLVRTLRSSPDPIDRTQAGYVLLGFAPAFAGTWVLTALELLRGLGTTPSSFEVAFLSYASPLVELGAAAVTAYAIVKYQLLGIEFKVRTGAKYILTSVGILSILFVVNEYVTEFILQPVFGFTQFNWIVAAVVAALFFKPLEGVAEWLTKRVFPEAAHRSEEHDSKRAAEIYHAQVSYVLRDARVSDRELKILQHLREHLGLSAAEAKRIEQRVEALWRVDSPRTGASRRRATT